jgi:hypothetical protein
LVRRAASNAPANTVHIAVSAPQAQAILASGI